MATPDLFQGVDPDVQSLIRAYCGWHVAPSITETIVLDGPGSSSLLLPSLHVTAVSEVLNDGRVVTDPEWSEAGIIRGSWTERLRGVQVTFTHGYAELPSAIMAAAARLLQRAKLAGAGSVSIGGISVSGFPATVPGAGTTGDGYVDAVLAEYRVGLRP